jgi:hypothetical protein
MCAIPLCVGFILVNAGAQLAPANPMGYIQIRLIDSISSFFELFWWMMTIGVIWVGVFGALKMAGGLYAASAEKIKQFGESWGKVALKAPLAMPLIPGNAGSPTLLQLGKKFTPGQYNAALSQPGGLPQMIKDIKAGKTVGGATTPNSAGLNGGSHTDAQLLDIHKDLKDLQKEIAAAGGNKKLEQDAINKFQGSSSGQLSTLKIDISNPGKSVREYAAGLKASGNKATARVNDIETLSKTF